MSNKKHICITGSQGTGKTTLRKSIISALESKNIELHQVNEVVRYLISKGEICKDDIQINKNNTAKDNDYVLQEKIFNEYYNVHSELKDISYISDRCALDPLVYTLYLSKHSNDNIYKLYNEQYNKLKELITAGILKDIYYIPIEFVIESDDVRDGDLKFQRDIDDNFKFIIEKLVEETNINIYEITGSLEERTQKILSIYFK